MLSTDDHSRDSAGMRYVYPVVSRRAGGISIGINLNPNNACNWRCVYCQVPDLKRGGPPPIDLALLAAEFEEFLRRAAAADFLQRVAPAGARRIVDVAFSGNGEPTSAPEFGAALDIVAQALERHGLLGKVKIRLITNGSLVDRVRVREALTRLGRLGGEVWFKVDAVGPAPSFRINGVRMNADTVRRRLRLCGGLVETWVQTCVFAWDGTPPAEAEVAAYVDFLPGVQDAVAGVLLYGLARPSLQPEASRLGRLPESWLGDLAGKIEKLGLTVRVSP
ncbi:radical SAM protein [Sulfurisoma sediminicola]|uniref:Radical SAM family protein n=1 Tax=Sulfurisoma sediminicola TaxID=1381557 RepID=A0A497XCY1_9PROT|nr:radical SAM protein [Sulfurisoma sediminicola]RLJ64584.1 radical SAM family protein [Sulfurisoma sediminicola]